MHMSVMMLKKYGINVSIAYVSSWTFWVCQRPAAQQNSHSLEMPTQLNRNIFFKLNLKFEATVTAKQPVKIQLEFFPAFTCPTVSNQIRHGSKDSPSDSIFEDDAARRTYVVSYSTT